MTTKSLLLLFAFWIVIGSSLIKINGTFHLAQLNHRTAANAAQWRVIDNYGKLPLSFEENQGQTDSNVRFVSRGAGYNLFLTADEAVLSLKKPQGGSQAADEKGNPLRARVAQIARLR